MAEQAIETTPSLSEWEAVIERGLKKFVEVGAALLTIRDQRLYREAYATFEDYCRERWGWNRARADQMIRASIVVAELDTIVSPPQERSASP